MKELIDKAAIVAEIEKRVNEYPCDNSEQDIGYHCALYEMQDFINSLKVKEVDLEEEVDLLIKSSTWAMANKEDALPTLAAVESFERGAEWQLANLWHDAQGDDLPPIDEEVIVLCINGKVCFGHRPNLKGFNCKNVDTGEMEHLEPMTYGKGGWNIPDVRWWLDVELPNMEEQQ